MDFSGYSDRRPITDGYFSANENRFTKLDTKMIKANDPEIYNVKIDKFSRRSEQMFYPIKHIKPEGKAVTHGGMYYSREYKDRIVFK